MEQVSTGNRFSSYSPLRRGEQAGENNPRLYCTYHEEPFHLTFRMITANFLRPKNSSHFYGNLHTSINYNFPKFSDI